MSDRRLARLNEQIKREISEIIRTDVRDPRIGIPTVTEVDVTSELWLARIFVRPDPTKEGVDVEEMLDGLEHAAPFIRRALGRALEVRRVPELRFLPDRTLEHALRIERILHEVLPEPENGAGEESEGDASNEEGAADPHEPDGERKAAAPPDE